MSYVRHEAIIVNGYRAEEVAQAHSFAVAIFRGLGMEQLVSPLSRWAVNGGASFFVAPDGSKEGWTESDLAEAGRKRLLKRLELLDDSLDWVLVLVGGDDKEFRVLRSSETCPRAGVAP